jgi:hypothetical protein
MELPLSKYKEDLERMRGTEHPMLDRIDYFS